MWVVCISNQMGSCIVYCLVKLNKQYYCDNIRLCPVQDQRRAHAMHILSIGDKGETQQNDLIRLLQPHMSHRSQISQFALKQLIDITDLTDLTDLTVHTSVTKKG